MSFEERPYQIEAHNALIDYWNTGGGNPLIVLPTGAGKSYQMAKFHKYAIEQFPGTRPLVLAHVPELLTQNFQELLSIWPQAPAGIYSASLGQRKINSQILFAGIQSIHRSAPYPAQVFNDV
jgi:DNA repair protein RadD